MSEHHHSNHISKEKSVTRLVISFIINVLLSVIEILGGIISQSTALVADALHNLSDAFSILVAVIAYKIGTKKATCKYTYGFKRAETIGGFVNLILLFISGIYLLFEGTKKLFYPEVIDGKMIIYISIIALLIDTYTAKISHNHSHHNTNMRMVFIHNLSDALGSIGVIISGLCVLLWDIYIIDGIIAILISLYMLWQAIISFPKIINILMNACPDNLNIEDISTEILKIKGVYSVGHIHIWQIDEQEIALECHVVLKNHNLVSAITQTLQEKFSINHINIQVDTTKECSDCHL